MAASPWLLLCRYTEHVNDRLLTAACVLQVLLFLQEEEEESSPETQMKTNKGTCGSPLHICSFCFFLSPLSSSSPLLTGVSWYTGFYWSGRAVKRAFSASTSNDPLVYLWPKTEVKPEQHRLLQGNMWP